MTQFNISMNRVQRRNRRNKLIRRKQKNKKKKKERKINIGNGFETIAGKNIPLNHGIFTG